MQRMIDKRISNPVDEAVLSIRCTQCGSIVHSGKELEVDDRQILCEGCYRFMVGPDAGDDIPSKWF